VRFHHPVNAADRSSKRPTAERPILVKRQALETTTGARVRTRNHGVSARRRSPDHDCETESRAADTAVTRLGTTTAAYLTAVKGFQEFS